MWHITIDQPGGKSMPPLVGCEVNRLPELVTNVASAQPAFHGAPVGVRAQRVATVGVRGHAREQVRVAARPAFEDPPLLGSDLGFEFLVDRHRGLTLHLVVVVAQIGRLLPVVQQTVEREAACVGDPQTAADQYQRDQPTLRVWPSVQVRWLFDLGHHMLGEESGDSLTTAGEVSGEERRRGGQVWVPPVLADRLEEQVQAADAALVGAHPAGQSGQPGEVAFQQRTVDVSDLNI